MRVGNEQNEQITDPLHYPLPPQKVALELELGKCVRWVAALAEGGNLSFEILLNLPGNPSHHATVVLNQFQVHPLPSPSLEHLPIGSQCPEVEADVESDLLAIQSLADWGQTVE